MNRSSIAHRLARIAVADHRHPGAGRLRLAAGIAPLGLEAHHRDIRAPTGETLFTRVSITLVRG